METAISYLKLLPLGKEEVQNYFNQLKNEVLEGNDNPLIFKKHISSLSLLIKMVSNDSEIGDLIMDEAEKHGERTFDYLDCNFQIKESAAKYDFTECNHDEWDNLHKTIESKIKDRKKIEKQLKSMSKEMADPSTGEIIYPPKKQSKTIVQITLK